MNNGPETKPKSRNSKFIPFFLILLIAVSIGLAIRHYFTKQQVIPHQGGLEVYFSKGDSSNSDSSLEKILILKLNLATEKIDAALYQLKSKQVTDTLIKAHKNGINVQVMTENE
ncbi:hypothetical protein F4212_00165, partial [Candidatus Poribacteria bacterium]|nr:hypothetical protein [Candidatus Poribacteria bacterium]